MGEILWDMLPDGKKLGGAPANFASHVAQFGLPAVVVSAVGNDTLGTEIEEALSLVGMEAVMPHVAFPTGSVQVQVDSHGIPQYQIMEHVAWDNIPFTDELRELAAETVAVCFGSLAQRTRVSRDTIERFLDAIPPSNNPLKVFDINLRGDYYDRETIEKSLERCNVLKINDEELVVLSHMFGFPDIDSLEACRRLFERYGLKVLILTCGTNGSYVLWDGGVSFQPTPLVEVADTVGAGDSFTAAFISGMLKGKSVEQSHGLAVKTSAYVCSQYGAVPRLPREYTCD